MSHFRMAFVAAFVSCAVVSVSDAEAQTVRRRGAPARRSINLLVGAPADVQSPVALVRRCFDECLNGEGSLRASVCATDGSGSPSECFGRQDLPSCVQAASAVGIGVTVQNIAAHQCANVSLAVPTAAPAAATPALVRPVPSESDQAALLERRRRRAESACRDVLGGEASCRRCYTSAEGRTWLGGAIPATVIRMAAGRADEGIVSQDEEYAYRCVTPSVVPVSTAVAALGTRVDTALSLARGAQHGVDEIARVGAPTSAETAGTLAVFGSALQRLGALREIDQAASAYRLCRETRHVSGAGAGPCGEEHRVLLAVESQYADTLRETQEFSITALSPMFALLRDVSVSCVLGGGTPTQLTRCLVAHQRLAQAVGIEERAVVRGLARRSATPLQPAAHAPAASGNYPAFPE